VLVDINEKTGISTLKMNYKPVNCMALNFLKDFCGKIDFLEQQKVKGMILTSSVKNVFSAGLDSNEVVNAEEEKLHAYWFWFQECFIKLYGCSFPSVALVNGHALAGGCVLALCCEYRVMLPSFTIGLNETLVGIVPPEFVSECARNVLPTRKAEIALTAGTSFKTDEALTFGMIDEIAADEADAVARCESFLSRYSKIPPFARAATKLNFRKETLELLTNPQNRSADAKTFIDHLLRPSTQKDMEHHFSSLKKNKK